MRKRSAYQPRQIRAPVMKELRDQIAMGMYTAYDLLSRTGHDETALDQLRDIFNLVGIAIEGDARFADETAKINAAAMSVTHNGKREQIATAVTAIDDLLSRLDVASLYNALVRLRTM